MGAADLGRRARALVVVVGRHAHVDDRELGLVLADQREQRVGVARPADDLVAGVLEQPGEALAQEHGVLGDHDAHGSCTAIRVPAPGGLSIGERPALRGDAVAHARQPVPPRGPAPPTPSSAIDQPQHAVLARGLDAPRASATRA